MIRLVFFCFLVFLFTSCAKKVAHINKFQSYTAVKVGAGPEDFQLDTITGNRLIISCDERREEKTQGSIWEYNLTTLKAEKMLISPALYFNFHPHGLFLFYTNNTHYLYVINHVNSENSEIDRFIIFKDSLVLDKRYTNIIGSPNDLVVMGLDEFYYTDYKTVGGSIVHYNKEPKKVIKGLKMANGIYIENNNLYFTTTLNGEMYLSDIPDFKKTKFSKINGGDNIMPYSENEFLVTSHIDFKQFSKHAKDVNEKSPSLVYKVNKNTGEKEILFYDNGEKISAVSTAFSYKGKLYLSQVFDDFILIAE